MEVTITEANESNIIAISELTREFFPYIAMNADKVYERMKQGVKYLVAREGDRTIGFVDYEIIEKPAETHAGVENKKTAKILGICVDSAYQGKGMGRMLLERVLEEVKDVEQVVLLVEEENAKAIKMYEKYGFRVQGKLERQMWDKEILMMVKTS